MYRGLDIEFKKSLFIAIKTDKTLPILFPMENVRSEAALLCGIRSPMYIDIHDGRRFRRDAPPAIPPPTAYEKSTQGCHGITATLVTSGDLVQLCQITMRLLLNVHLPW